MERRKPGMVELWPDQPGIDPATMRVCEELRRRMMAGMAAADREANRFGVTVFPGRRALGRGLLEALNDATPYWFTLAELEPFRGRVPAHRRGAACPGSSTAPAGSPLIDPAANR